MNEETKVETITLYRFKSQEELDAFRLSAQWPEDVKSFKKLITPTNLTELNLGE